MPRQDSRFWFPFFTFISTFITIPLIKGIGVDQIYITPVSAIFSALLFVSFDRLTNELLSNIDFRKRFDSKRSKFEGEWLEYYISKDSNGDREQVYYAYFRIRYTGKEGEPYLIKGNAYYADGRSFARWASTMIKFDGNRGIVDYFYNGYFFDKQYSVRGLANLSFNDKTSYAILPSATRPKPGDIHKGELQSGTGFFVDSSAGGTAKNRFHFVRIDDELVKTVVGSADVGHTDAERFFVVRFHEIFGKAIMEKGYWLSSNSNGMFDALPDPGNELLPG